MNEESEKTNPSKIPKSIRDFILSILKEIYKQKKWVLIPLWVLLAAIALLIFLEGGSPLLPSIYIDS